MTIKEFRNKYHLSREDLASKVGISWMTIYRYEEDLIKKPNRVIKEKLDRIMRGYNAKN